MRRLAFLLAVPLVFVTRPAYAATPTTINLAIAGNYSVLGGQTVTNTGPSTLAAGLAVFPGTAVTGFPPGSAPVIQAATAEALQAQTDLTAAYLDASLRQPTGSVSGDIVGQTFVSGVYNASSSLFVSGTVTLDGQGDPNSVFIFQTGSTLITASASRIVLVNGALPCNVFWQVGSSATLGTGSKFVGTIMALTSITVTTGVTVEGRALARNGSTTLDSDVFIQPGCTPPPVVTTSAETTPPPETTGSTAPAEVTTSIVSAGGTTSVVSFPPSVGTIGVPTTECKACEKVTAPTQSSSPSATPDTTVPCVPKAKSHEFVYAMGGVTVGGAVCGGTFGLLRFLRRRAIGV